MLHSRFLSNYATVKKYSDTCYKVTNIFTYTPAGFEDEKKVVEKCSVNEQKLKNNLARARGKIFEYALCNPWELFVTFTLDKTKYDRYNLRKFNADLSQFLRDYNKKHKLGIKFLLIPEHHEDGAWHMHGFLMGLPLDHLHEFQLSERLPVKILKRLSAGKRVFTWKAYAKRFGFSDIEVIENHEASSKYITKYVSKEAMTTIKELNAHIYYCSKGLKTAQVIAKGLLQKDMQADYMNDYIAVKNLNTEEEALSYVRQAFDEVEFPFLSRAMTKEGGCHEAYGSA